MHNFDSQEVLPCKIAIVHTLIASGHSFIKETKPRKSLECLWKKRTSCSLLLESSSLPCFLCQITTLQCTKVTVTITISIHGIIICDKNGGLISSYLCLIWHGPQQCNDLSCSWLSWWYLSWARASPASNVPGPPYHDKPFPKSGADHESSVIVFSTGVFRAKISSE